MQLSEIAALIRTSCHQVRCWKDVERVKPFLGSFNGFIVNTNCVNERSVGNITSAKRENQLILQHPNGFKNENRFLPVLRCTFLQVVLRDVDISYQFLLEVLMSLLQNFLCLLQNCIFCFELSNFLSVLLVHSPLAAQFPHQTFQLYGASRTKKGKPVIHIFFKQ